MDTCSRIMLPVIQLVLSPDGSKSMIETLLGLHNPQISIQLRIYAMRPNGASGYSSIQSEGIGKRNLLDMVPNSSEHYQQLVGFIPRRIHSVFRAKGGPILH
ncbi:hypothetical protein TNCV_3587841 [Trichonephila clavipes]|nr:hypothetical protein TNCV_3587841 [Trichonephila clavipes]